MIPSVDGFEMYVYLWRIDRSALFFQAPCRVDDVPWLCIAIYIPELGSSPCQSDLRIEERFGCLFGDERLKRMKSNYIVIFLRWGEVSNGKKVIRVEDFDGRPFQRVRVAIR